MCNVNTNINKEYVGMDRKFLYTIKYAGVILINLIIYAI